MFQNNKFFLISLFFSIAILSTGLAQQARLHSIPGLPSSEVYDILADSKGFLWIAHNTGISKYDGISFSNFSHPEQSSLSTSGLLEDRFGRIWFKNFTGQIFYIENGHVNLLRAYLNAGEDYFPNIGLIKDLLIATTRKGLFICDTRTLQSHYELCSDPTASGTTSICVLKDKVVAYGNGNWFVYKPGGHVRSAVYEGSDRQAILENSSTLCKVAFHDTMFLFSNPSNILYKLILKNDTVRLCEKKRFNCFINTVSVFKENYWINTIEFSVAGTGNKARQIKGYDISSMVDDADGNHWFGSLQQGLLATNFDTDSLKETYLIRQTGSEALKCLVKIKDQLFLGSQNGNIYEYNANNDKLIKLVGLSLKHGGTLYMKALDDDHLLIGTSVNTYLFNIKTKENRLIEPVKSLKQAESIPNAILCASSRSLIIYPDSLSPQKDRQILNSYKNEFKGLSEGKQGGYLELKGRCRAVCYTPETNTIWTSFKDGLYKINRDGVKLIKIGGTPVYASCLISYNGRTIVGTFNNGILVFDRSSTRRITIDDGLLSSNILKLKADGKYLWVFVGGSIQFFNLQTFKLLNKYELPGRDYGIINDADEINKTCYVTTQNGFYKVGKSAQNKKDTKIYLTSLFINGRDTGQIKNLKLPYNFSDVQINLGTPHLSDAQDILIKYRLKQKDSSRWVYSRRRERSFHFASLMPGKYQFEALAIRGQTGLSSSPLIIDFEILPPWWRRWWALCLWGLMASMLIFFSSRWYYLNMLDKRSAEYEKELAIQEERQRISSEMHDDIGAGLSALKLYTRAGAGSDGADNLAVNELVTELSEKVREVIWSLSINDDSLENLLYFVQANCHSMFERTEIILKVTMPDVIPEVKFDGFARRNVYLIVREAMHNIIKHSKASNAHLIFKISHHLDIQINDNGIGIDNDAGTGAGGKYGIKNMQSRAVALGGKMVIKTNNGTHLSIKVPLGQKVPRRRHR